MTYDIKIEPDFRDLLNPLSEEEYNALEASILKDGVEDPLKVWNGILVDGHNRLEICKKHGIENFPVKEKHFESKSDAMNWIIENQKGRRNLTMSQLVKCYAKVEEQMAKEAKERMSQGGGDKVSEKARAGVSNLKQAVKSEPRTVDKIAEKVGVSRNTYLAAKQVVEKGTPEEIKRLDKGGKGNGAQRIASEIKARELGITEKTCSKCGKIKPISQFNPSGSNGDYRTYCIECECAVKNAHRNRSSKEDKEVAKNLNLDEFVVSVNDNEVVEVSMDRIEREIMGAVDMFLNTVRQTASDDFDHGDRWKEILVKAQQKLVTELAEL